MGLIEYRINEEEIFNQTCALIVQKKRIFKRGPGDNGMTHLYHEHMRYSYMYDHKMLMQLK